MESDVYANVKKEINKKKFACVSKCASTTIPSTLVCINCGNPYHLGCIERMKNVQHVKGNLIVWCSNSTTNTYKDKENLLANSY